MSEHRDDVQPGDDALLPLSDSAWAEVMAGMADEGFHWHRCADCPAFLVHLDDRMFLLDDQMIRVGLVEEPFVCDEPQVPFNVDCPADLPPSSMICERCAARRWSRNLHARKRELRARRRGAMSET